MKSQIIVLTSDHTDFTNRVLGTISILFNNGTFRVEELLSTLLERLQLIGEEHDELYDSEVREQMGMVIMEGFIRDHQHFPLPEQFGMFSNEANRKVKIAIVDYIERANKKASELGLTRFHDRLAAFQNPKVQASVPGNDYEELFGHTPPEFYDEYGNVVRTY